MSTIIFSMYFEFFIIRGTALISLNCRGSTIIKKMFESLKTIEVKFLIKIRIIILFLIIIQNIEARSLSLSPEGYGFKSHSVLIFSHTLQIYRFSLIKQQTRD